MISFDPYILAPYFGITETVVSVGPSSTPLASGNASRVALIIANPSANLIIATTKSPAGGTKGIPVAANTGVLILYYSQVGALVGVPWYGWSTGAVGENIIVIEVTYRPPPPAPPPEESTDAA